MISKTRRESLSVKRVLHGSVQGVVVKLVPIIGRDRIISRKKSRKSGFHRVSPSSTDRDYDLNAAVVNKERSQTFGCKGPRIVDFPKFGISDDDPDIAS